MPELLLPIFKSVVPGPGFAAALGVRPSKLGELSVMDTTLMQMGSTYLSLNLAIIEYGKFDTAHRAVIVLVRRWPHGV